MGDERMTDIHEPVWMLALDAPVSSLWRHRKGGTYRIVGHAMIEASMTPAVIYESLSGDAGLWVRPGDEFLDGRFTRGIDATTPTGANRGAAHD
jgi:hypothetical protein